MLFRTLAVLALQNLFDEVPLYYLWDSFDKLVESAHSKHCTAAVRSLCFHADQLDDLYFTEDSSSVDRWNLLRETMPPHHPTHDMWLDPNDNLQFRSPPSGDRMVTRQYKRTKEIQRGVCKRAGLKIAYNHYKKLLREQSHRYGWNLQREKLADFMRACPNLNHVVITMADQLRLTSNRNVKEFQRAIVRPFGDDYWRGSAVESLNLAMVAAFDAGKSIQRLEIANLSPYYFNSNSGPRQGLNLEAAMQVVENVQELRLGFVNNVIDDDRSEVVNRSDLCEIAKRLPKGCVVKFLAHAQTLRKLELKLPYSIDKMSKIDLAQVVGDCTWRELTHLDLTMFRCTSDYLVDLLKRHETTLTGLRLCDVTLSEGRWTDCFQRIAGKLPKLSKVTLRGQFTCSDLVAPALVTSLSEDSHDPEECVPRLERYLVAGGELPTHLFNDTEF